MLKLSSPSMTEHECVSSIMGTHEGLSCWEVLSMSMLPPYLSVIFSLRLLISCSLTAYHWGGEMTYVIVTAIFSRMSRVSPSQYQLKPYCGVIAVHSHEYCPRIPRESSSQSCRRNMQSLGHAEVDAAALREREIVSCLRRTS